MDFEDYQQRSRKTAQYPKLGIPEGSFVGWIYPAIGLTGESGEVLENVKKLVRSRNLVVTDEIRETIKKELGDVLWYISQLSTELGISLKDVAISNLQKLESRQERGVIHGVGDER